MAEVKPLIRHHLTPADREPIRRLLTATEAFRPDEVDTALELVDETLDPRPDTDYRWALAEVDSQVVGFGCFGLVPLTDATFDLYWIAVDPAVGRAGVASTILREVETVLQSEGARWLLAETSSLPAYAPARAFYVRSGYPLLTRIADFYRPGDDRLTFGKRLDHLGQG